MIDGGPKSVYGPHLKPRLLEIRKARGLDSQQPLPVDLLMVSHVDDDHIQGILDLTRELRAAAGRAVRPHPTAVAQQLRRRSSARIPKELTAASTAQFGAASLDGDLPDRRDHRHATARTRKSSAPRLKVLASIAQGHRLRLDAEALRSRANPEFDGKLILAAEEPVALSDGLTFTVAGPMQPELKALQKKHDEWLKELKEKGLTPEEALAAYVDKSVPNLSSLVVLAEAGGKTMLLTGDARGDKILAGPGARSARWSRAGSCTSTC